MFEPGYYLPQHQEEQADPSVLDNLTLEQLTSTVNKAS